MIEKELDEMLLYLQCHSLSAYDRLNKNTEKKNIN